MEKIILENDIKGLEQEIDSAIDRLFVEERRGLKEGLTIESPILEPSYSPPPPSLPSLKSVEKMETQLLSLEWEVTGETLKKIKEEIFSLRETFKETSDIKSVLNLMARVLDLLMEDEVNIRPSQLRFLLDALATIKLLMRKDQDEEISNYKKLAYAGIEARYTCLEESLNRQTQPFSSFNGEINKTAVPPWGEKKGDYPLSPPVQRISKTTEKQEDKASPKTDITIFKVGDKLFGVESDKIFKLYKVPNTFCDRYSNHGKIRLKNVEVKMVNLRKLFSIHEKDPMGQNKILTVKDNGGYKGWLVVQVFKK